MVTKKLMSLALFVFLVGCGTPTSSEISSSVNATISVQDQFIEVGDTISPDVVFTPISSIDTYTFTTTQTTIITIRNNIITGVGAGVGTVQVVTTNTNLTTTFQVIVTEKPVVVSPLEAFNTLGTFENSLTGWTLSGPTASVMSTDTDGDRNENDLQLKLWTDGLIDFTLSYTFASFPTGDHTLMFDLVAGNMTTITVTIGANVYSWQDGEVIVRSSGYTTNYFLINQSIVGPLTISFYFFAPQADIGWGFLDNVMIEVGDQRPEPEPAFENLLQNGSFETGTLQHWNVTGTLNGQLSVNTQNPKTGTRNLAYWGNNRPGDNFTISQTLTAVPSGNNYRVSVSVINGDDQNRPLTSAKLFVEQGSQVYQTPITVRGWNAGYITYVIDNIVLNSEEPVIVGVQFEPGSGVYWMQLDDVALLQVNG
jgi:hypothetical protein